MVSNRDGDSSCRTSRLEVSPKWYDLRAANLSQEVKHWVTDLMFSGVREELYKYSMLNLDVFVYGDWNTSQWWLIDRDDGYYSCCFGVVWPPDHNPGVAWLLRSRTYTLCLPTFRVGYTHVMVLSTALYSYPGCRNSVMRLIDNVTRSIQFGARPSPSRRITSWCWFYWILTQPILKIGLWKTIRKTEKNHQ